MVSFILLAVIVVGLALVSVIPGGEWLYSSPLFVAGWCVLALVSLWVMVRRRLYRRPALFLLHISFVVILAGAMITHIWGTSQVLHLRVGDAGFVGRTPVTLIDFRVEYYPGTVAPSDFISTLEVGGRDAVVAMNRVAKVDGYRFFQTSYDSDRCGSVLTVTHDPVGVAVTYSGYFLLLFGMILTAVPRRSRRFAAAMLPVACFGVTSAAPRVLPADVASRFGDLAVSHGGRVTSVSSLARDFSVKLTGSARYSGLSPEQVLTGWLFFYDDWKSEPCIRIKDSGTRRALGVDGRMVSLTDFFDSNGGYRLSDGNAHAAANELFSLASGAAAGSMWRLFPVGASDGSMTWYSPVDDLPDSLSVETWTLTRHSLNYLAELVGRADWAGVCTGIEKIRRYQLRSAPDVIPGRVRMSAEKWLACAGGSMAIPALLLIASVALMLASPRRSRRWGRAVVLPGSLWAASLIAAAWIASGRLPMASGAETMLWLSLCAMLVALFSRRLSAVGGVVGALALIVAAMGLRSPQLTPLMPVLRSPLLSVHVLCVMASYALLALIAVCSVAYLAGRRELMDPARTLLRPAVYLMAAGIFIGAMWANTSWGRYWGWDPKEVWALITMLVYCVPLHGGMLPVFRSERTYAIYCAVAFVTVLMTYFGVNFVLGGLHSYA
ncbi:MAG: cytochrome c biogenesis protein CcsA [Muribaculaceae bacterium]|nr:cytochrome c biogenesis protein CcsA [Muribaculaceae bacterium]